MDFRNLKIVKRLQSLSPRLRWLVFSQVQDLKIGTEYIDYLIPSEAKSPQYDGDKLEQMVRDTIVKEFSPKIKDSKSYELLVDAVVHNLKKKQLAALKDSFGDEFEEDFE